jgi:HK97 gp10 family phage protein
MATSVVVQSFIPIVTAKVHAKAVAVTAKAAHDVEAHAKGNAAVDTGHMRNAINTVGKGLTYEVHSPAEYSVYVELGTSRMAAQPFMMPALEFVRPSYLAAMRSLA